MFSRETTTLKIKLKTYIQVKLELRHPRYHFHLIKLQCISCHCVCERQMCVEHARRWCAQGAGGGHSRILENQVRTNLGSTLKFASYKLYNMYL